MMTIYNVLKLIHIIGASVLLGTGAGIAFFMLLAHRTGNPVVIAGVARIVVIADFLFTASAVVLQPVTGIALAHIGGFPIVSGWIAWAVLLYVLTGVFWLPVVWMQVRMRDLAAEAAACDRPLPPAYHRLFRRWFLLGFPAFSAVLAIFWLMISKPA
jgi:uncharacterized membrane protein